MIEWQNDSPQKRMTWHEAVDYAKSLGDGWRLPTRGELIDAYDSSVRGFMNDYYWSSSAYAQGTSSVWSVNFGSGLVASNVKTNGDYVRCVMEIKE